MNDPSPTWHADTDVLHRYARGDVDPARAYSLEAHLLECASCRHALAPAVDADRLDQSWNGLAAALDAPRPGLAERALGAVGIRDDTARLLAATPTLRLSWVVGVVLALGFAVAAAHGGQGERSLLLFLIVAPLLPVAGVAAAFTRRLDPTYDVALAAPLPAFHLLLIRSTAVLGTTLAVATVAAVGLPDPGWIVAGWLVPAVALTVVSLAAATFVSPFAAATTVASLWVGGVVGSEVVSAGTVRALLRPGPISSAAFTTGGQLTLVVVTALAVLVISGRHDRFEIGRTP